MSNRLFQGIIHQMGDAANRTIGVIDDTGVIIACSELVKIGEARHGIHDELAYTSDAVTVEGYTYRPIGTAAKWEYIVFVEGEDDTAERLADILSISLSTIKNLYDEKYDKNSFIKNIILDNILPSDIYIKGKELRFNTEEVRVVFLIKFLSRTEVLPFNMVQQIFPDKNKDYVISISEQDIVVVKEVKAGSESKELVKLASSIEETLMSELSVKCLIGIGSVSSQMKDIAKSFKEATTAIEVGAVFDTEKNIISFENLGIGRLIYQLPITLCEMFLSEVFKKGSIDSLDQETLFTIQKFFENNLNVSETSRKLFVHRNTLVYRLEKIKKLTGLDLREFDHAIVFKVALMVRKYLASREEGVR